MSSVFELIKSLQSGVTRVEEVRWAVSPLIRLSLTSSIGE